MNEHTFLHHLETLGYFPLPRSHPDCPGYSGLLVVLRQEPHGHEPERIQLHLQDWDGQTAMIQLHADMDHPFSHVVCPGRVIINSRQEREVTFYSFGGSLESETLAGETVYSLRSVAPVLELVPEQETIANLLADKTEILFAEAEAEQRLSFQQLLQRLVKAGPEAVYLAVLQSLLLEAEDMAVSHRERDFIKVLNRERTWYQKTGRWPLFPHDLATLLQVVNE